jgi:hypothetical protein
VVGHLGGRVKCSNGRAAELIDGYIASRGGNLAKRFHNFRVFGMRVGQECTFNVRDMCNFK